MTPRRSPGARSISCGSTPDRWPRTSIYLYGFDDFTLIELDTIETIVRQEGVQVTVSLTLRALGFPRPGARRARATVVEDLRELAQIVSERSPALDEYYEPEARDRFTIWSATCSSVTRRA